MLEFSEAIKEKKRYFLQFTQILTLTIARKRGKVRFTLPLVLLIPFALF